MITEGIPADVDKICSAMRAARNYMVQTEVQYLFIWKTLADACRDMLGDAVVPGSDEVSRDFGATMCKGRGAPIARSSGRGSRGFVSSAVLYGQSCIQTSANACSRPAE